VIPEVGVSFERKHHTDSTLPPVSLENQKEHRFNF
jgi:hypothetical protein